MYETLPPIAGFGLSRLPEPSAGDIFFDFEGDPFVGDGGLEFLFGYLYLDADGAPQYVGDWASNRQDERAAFERFIDFVIVRLATYPDLHIYHFAPYEPAALKRLMGRYANARKRSRQSAARGDLRRSFCGRPPQYPCQRRKLFDQETRAALFIRTDRAAGGRWPCNGKDAGALGNGRFVGHS